MRNTNYKFYRRRSFKNACVRFTFCIYICIVRCFDLFFFSFNAKPNLQHTISIIRCNDIINVRYIFHHRLKIAFDVDTHSFTPSVSQLIIYTWRMLEFWNRLGQFITRTFILSFSHRCCGVIISCSSECQATNGKKEILFFFLKKKQNRRIKTDTMQRFFNSYRHT